MRTKASQQSSTPLFLHSLSQVDPFSSLRKIWHDKTILMLCLTVFLSYLPEAGQYSCFFVYLRLVMDFDKESVAMFIAAVGILSVIAQTGLLTLLMKTIGAKHTIMVGLLFEMLQGPNSTENNLGLKKPSGRELREETFKI